MTQTQIKLKKHWEAILEQADHNAKHGDKSSHSGYFNPETGDGEPPYTGDGLVAEEDIKDWEKLKENPLTLFDLDCVEDLPELVYQAFKEWIILQNQSVGYVTQHLDRRLRVFIVQAFIRDFFKVATGKDFKVVEVE